MILSDNADKKTMQQQLDEYRELNKFVDFEMEAERKIVLPAFDVEYWLKAMRVGDSLSKDAVSRENYKQLTQKPLKSRA
jgi:hypothetical protein